MDTCAKSQPEECEDKPVIAEKRAPSVDDNGVPFESKTYYLRIGVHAAASLVGLGFGLLWAYIFTQREGVKTGWFYSLFDDPFGFLYTILYVEYSITFFRPSVYRALDWRCHVGLEGQEPDSFPSLAILLSQLAADNMFQLVSFRMAGFFWKMDIYHANCVVGSLIWSMFAFAWVFGLRVFTLSVQLKYKEFREAQEQQETGEVIV